MSDGSFEVLMLVLWGVVIALGTVLAWLALRAGVRGTSRPLLALAAGHWLSLHYALPRLNLYYLVGGVLALWGIGQLAAWQPAARAAAVPPSVATRTV